MQEQVSILVTAASKIVFENKEGSEYLSELQVATMMQLFSTRTLFQIINDEDVAEAIAETIIEM